MLFRLAEDDDELLPELLLGVGEGVLTNTGAELVLLEGGGGGTAPLMFCWRAACWLRI